MRFALFASDRNGNDAISIAPEERFELCSSSLLDYDRLWRFGGAGLSAARSRADVIFVPTAATLPIGPVPAVCTIHDVTPITMPSHSKKVGTMQRVLMKGCARFSRAIITSSECSKKDIVTLLDVPGEKVSVVHDGCDHALFNAMPAEQGKESRVNVHNTAGIGADNGSGQFPQVTCQADQTDLMTLSSCPSSSGGVQS